MLVTLHIIPASINRLMMILKYKIKYLYCTGIEPTTCAIDEYLVHCAKPVVK
jgi:hypothetical protein